MEDSKMKNMVVLRNLPSNLVEEAIVVLKSNKKVKKLEKIEKKVKKNKSETSKKEDYILKEAEMIVSTYISKLENDNRERTIKTIKNSKKYTRLKRYAYLTSIIMIVQTLLLILKWVIKPLISAYVLLKYMNKGREVFIWKDWWV